VIYLTSIFIRTIIIYVILTVMMKIMGKRRIGELEADELVSTLLISEIAAMPIGDNDIPIINAIIPIVFICALEVLLSAIKTRSRTVKHVIEGESTYIIYKGRLLQSALSENRLSINEILSEMRSQGIGDISEVYYAILEANGKLSIITKDRMGTAGHTLIVDGVSDEKKMMRLGYNRRWLMKVLEKHDVKEDKIFLMTVRDDGAITIITKEDGV
jgi:uncharacterized membrane protein YcaP (DUF421 family)